MIEEYDRLAWGYVREELRNLMKPRKTDVIQMTVAELIRPGSIQKQKGAGYYQGRSLNPTELAEVSSKLVSDIDKTLSPFRDYALRGRMGPEYCYSNFRANWFWNGSHFRYSENEFEDSREEELIDLMHLTYSLTKKKLVADLAACHVSLNQHVLYRMVQRGLVDKLPLAYLGENFEEWITYASAFLYFFAGSRNRLGDRFMIPFGNGALLCEAGSRLRAGDVPVERVRFVDGMKRARITEPPYASFLEDRQRRDSHYVIKIATWIPMDYFSAEQHWVYAKITELHDKYVNLFGVIFWTLMPDYHSIDIGYQESKADSTAFTLEMIELCKDHRWQWAFGNNAVSYNKTA